MRTEKINLKRILIYISVSILLILCTFNQTKAQENRCIEPKFNQEIPNGLIASNNELNELRKKFNNYRVKSKEYEKCINIENKLLKKDKKIADKINREIRIYQLTSSTSCELRFNRKEKIIEVNSPVMAQNFINELSEIDYPFDNRSASTYNNKLNDFALNYEKYIRNNCAIRYIFLFKAAVNFSRTGQCVVAQKYLEASKNILQRSRVKGVSGQEEQRLVNINNEVESCLRKIESKLEPQPKQPIYFDEDLNAQPIIETKVNEIDTKVSEIELLQSQIKALKETVHELNSEILRTKNQQNPSEFPVISTPINPKVPKWVIWTMLIVGISIIFYTLVFFAKWIYRKSFSESKNVKSDRTKRERKNSGNSIIRRFFASLFYNHRKTKQTINKIITEISSLDKTIKNLELQIDNYKNSNNRLEQEIYSENKVLFNKIDASINKLESCSINYIKTIKQALKKTEVKRKADLLKDELIKDIRKKLNIKSRTLRNNTSFSLDNF